MAVSTQRQIVWTDDMTSAFLDVYEETYIHIQRGNLSKMHWNEIVLEFYKNSGLSLNKDNCRLKLDNLKKRYKKERETFVSRSGGTPSSWTLYDRCDMLWGCTPKSVGLPGAMDGGVSIPNGLVVNLDDYYKPNNIDLNEYFITSNPCTPELTGYEALDCEFVEALGPRQVDGEKITGNVHGMQDGQAPLKSTESPCQKVCNLPNVHAKLSSKRKMKQRESPIKPLQASLDRFVDVLKHDSEVKIQLARDHLGMAQQMQLQQGQLQSQRMELEKLKLEMQELAAIRAEELKLKCARIKLDFSAYRGGSSL